jgi:Subtilase family/GEVED domain/Secretion system C-terminal sorting domain
MILKKFVPLILFAFCLFSTARSQVTTNPAALRAFSLRSEARNQEMTARLYSLAKLRGWPLTITGKNGKKSFLYGIGIKGLPFYVSTKDNIISAATIGTNQLWPGGSTGLSLNGSTAALKGKIAVWDEGRVLATHQELVGRVLQKDNPTSLSDHSTHVSGTMIAAGVNPVAKGMSFGALQLLAYDFSDNSDVPEMSNEALNLLISNHSYGLDAGWIPDNNNNWTWYGLPGDTVDYKFGYYDFYCQAFDTIAYSAPDYLIVMATGNSRGYNGPAVGQPYKGFDSLFNIVSKGNRPAGISSNDSYDGIAPPAGAKNVLSMGAVNPIPGGYTSPSDVVLAYFSSWGPTDDGRIKPDLVSDGVNVLSSISSSNNAYAILSGTSMASPAAAGSGFLLQEYYYKLHNTFMHSATLKGLLIHTADEAGPTPGPDYQYGYGLIDMPNAAAVITSNNTDKLIQEKFLTNVAGTYSLPVVASGKGPLTATICWTDPPGSVDTVNFLNNPTPKLVNDLDLRVTGNGVTYMPWVLNPLSPSSGATTGDDKINNVEKIQIPNAVPGLTYTISVTHKASLTNGAQGYSLIVSGVGSASYCPSASLSNTGTQIDQVNISNVSVTSPAVCTTYTDNTSHTISLQSNETIPFTIKLSSCDGSNVSRIVKIFIDYNNNGTFTDSGETAVISPVLNGGVTTFSGNLQVPSGMQTGNTTLLRIVAEETTNPDNVLPCGNYPLGETEDYTVTFVSLMNDVGISAVVDPLSGSCQADSQRISVRIKNSGTADQVNVPIHLKVVSANKTLIDETTVYPDTVSAQGSVIYTFQPAFKSVTGSTFIILAGTSLAGDQDSSNDAISDTVLISSGSEAVKGNAEICSTNPPLAGLKAVLKDQSDAVLWFDSPTATTPVASGEQATTTVIPANNTYYLGLNEMTGSIGPKSKMAFPNGGYNYFQGNFVRIHTDVPVTISTARLYIGARGKVNFIIADLADYDSCTGSYSYFPISSTTIDVYPTTQHPSRVVTSINSPLDTGAVFLLDLPIPTPGDHIIIIVAEDSAFLFRNNNISANPYPIGMPGIFTITGNSAINTANCKDTTFYQNYYYFFYDMQITLNKCASPRVPVVAITPVPVVISRVANELSSNYASGNQWYYNDTLIVSGTNQTFAIRGSGTYKVVVSDSVGCTLVSNPYNYSPGNDIGLAVLPNPNYGVFTVEFYQTEMANADLRVVDINGQLLYESNNPNFKGSFNQTISLGKVSAGTYVLQLLIGSKVYVQKIVVL